MNVAEQLFYLEPIKLTVALALMLPPVALSELTVELNSRRRMKALKSSHVNGDSFQCLDALLAFSECGTIVAVAVRKRATCYSEWWTSRLALRANGASGRDGTPIVWRYNTCTCPAGYVAVYMRAALLLSCTVVEGDCSP